LSELNFLLGSNSAMSQTPFLLPSASKAKIRMDYKEYYLPHLDRGHRCKDCCLLVRDRCI